MNGKEEPLTHSPIPTYPKRVQSFAEALEALLDDKKVRRTEWPDNGTYLTMNGNKVMIFKPEDNKLHPLILTDGDILGTDWMVITNKS